MQIKRDGIEGENEGLLTGKPLFILAGWLDLTRRKSDNI